VVDKIVLTGKKSAGVLRLNLKQVKEIVEGSKIQLIVLSTTHLNGAFEKLEELCEEQRVALRVLLGGFGRPLPRGEAARFRSAFPIYDHRGSGLKREAKSPSEVRHHRRLNCSSGAVTCVSGDRDPDQVGIERTAVSSSKRAHSVDKAEPFHFYKFRSMRVDADALKLALKIEE